MPKKKVEPTLLRDLTAEQRNALADAFRAGAIEGGIAELVSGATQGEREKMAVAVRKGDDAAFDGVLESVSIRQTAPQVVPVLRDGKAFAEKLTAIQSKLASAARIIGELYPDKPSDEVRGLLVAYAASWPFGDVTPSDLAAASADARLAPDYVRKVWSPGVVRNARAAIKRAGRQSND